MNVLVIGSGGREHALSWKIAQSPMLNKLFCLPGNPGTASIAHNIEGSVNDFVKIKEVVLANSIEIVVVGPEDPLVGGLGDFFANDSQLKDILFVGPCSKGAMLEGSKDFAKDFMSRHNIPTAAYRSFSEDNIKDAFSFLHTLKPPYVLKADGLAAGKGVLIIDNYEQACDSLREMFSGKFGTAGKKVVIEEFLSGIEVSVFVLTDGSSYMILPEAKDYKRIGDGDKGLNTGGMGAVSPVPFADAEFMSKVEQRIVIPTIEGLQKDAIPYKGFIFIGLMNCAGEPYVIEYNVRMGDPETEAVMTRIESDLLSHLKAAADGTLGSEHIAVSCQNAVTAIVVSGGYPESYAKGYPIFGLDKVEGVTLFHSGTALKDGAVVTFGGRVLAVTSLGDNLPELRSKLYEEIAKLDFTGINYRNDIGLDIINYKR